MQTRKGGPSSTVREGRFVLQSRRESNMTGGFVLQSRWERNVTVGEGQAADVYAIGVLLWEMVAHQRAWAGMLHAQVIV